MKTKLFLNLSVFLTISPFMLSATETDTSSYFGAYTCWTYEVKYYNSAQDLYMLSANGKIEGDTLINNTFYKQYHYGTNIIAVRQENKKIFAVNHLSDTEYLLYDFGLEIGDSISYSYEQDNYESRTGYIIDIDSVILANGKQYKRMFLGDKYGGHYATWIEGIGNVSIRGGFEDPYSYPEPTCLCGNYYNMLCFIRENEQIVSNLPQSSHKCSCGTSNNVENAAFKKNVILLRQDKDFLYLTVENNPIKSVEIFDVSGKKIIYKKAVSQIKINNLSNGIYVIQVMLQDNNTVTTKWFKQ